MMVMMGLTGGGSVRLRKKGAADVTGSQKV